ncbi:MAG: ion transporter [Alphaproteobacteria bacterium]|jgi:voltage-gated sodium channel
MKSPVTGAHAAARANNAPHVSTSKAAKPKPERPAGPENRLTRFVEARWFRTLVIGVIIANAIILGLLTSKNVREAGEGSVGQILLILDTIALAFFVCEIALKAAAYRLRFFRDPWNWFDLAVVAVAFVPATDSLKVLRALRVLRVLRLVAAIPAMRLVVSGLFRALPGMGSAALLLILIHYVFAVIGVQLYSGTLYGGYGADGYDYFGDLGRAFYTLFQIMTLESWSHGIVRPIMEVHPSSWVYFTLFVVISAFAALNLFIGILVNAMDSAKDEAESTMTADEVADPAQRAILQELHAIRAELAEMRAAEAAEKAED